MAEVHTYPFVAGADDFDQETCLTTIESDPTTTKKTICATAPT